MEKEISKNSIVQINENSQKEWIGCLVQVDEVKNWGVQGYLKIPMQGNAYIRLRYDEFDYIGEAALAQSESN